jgi:uncharacterized membrane protein
MTAYSIAVTLHIAAGSLALLLFWTAAVMRKGTALHRRVGQVYLLMMLGVIISGMPLAHAVLQRGSPVGALFLTFLLLLVSSGCWNAWRAIRHRNDRRAYFGALYWFFAATLALGGGGMIALGHAAGSALLMVFGSVGVVAAIGAVQSWRRAPTDPKWWLKEHYGAMIGNGVATHIAFIAVGLRNVNLGIDPQVQQQIAWFGPLLVAVFAAVWLNRRYGRSGARTMQRPRNIADRSEVAS